MKRTLLPSLAAAVIAGTLCSCATPAPRSPEDYVEQAWGKLVKAQGQAESRGKQRAAIFRRLKYRWQNFRISSHFDKAKLIDLQAICTLAETTWGGEVKVAFLRKVHAFANTDVISFYKMEGMFHPRERAGVNSAVLAVGRDLKDLIRVRAIKAKEYMAVWRPAESWAEMAVMQ